VLSDAEMERRWSLVRGVMHQQSLDWIVGSLGHPGGYLRWLTSRSSFLGALVAVPLRGELLLASHGDDIHHGPVHSHGVRQVVSCAHPNLLENNQAGALIAAFAAQRVRRIGVLGMGYFPAAALDALRRACPGAEFLDVSDLIAPLKAVKSQEELSCMRRAAVMHELAIDVVRNEVRIGVSARSVLNKVRALFFEHGSQSQTLMAGSAPAGSICKYAYGSDRVMQRGDQFAMLIEGNEVDGYYSEAMPTVCLGAVPDGLSRAFDDVAEIQARVVELLKPDADPGDLMRENNRLMVAKGYPPETRLLGHSQGVDLVERPALSPTGETLRFAENMVVSVHPTTHGEAAWGFPVNQSFLVTRGSPARMLSTPQEIIVVDG
jgi:Xaa-Pro aminopeptidase